MPTDALPSSSIPRSERTRIALFDAAATLFVAQGYEGTTMTQVAALAGTSRRTAFNYFPNKGDIPMLWVRQMADQAMVDVAMADGSPGSIRTYFRVISEAMASAPELSRQMMLGWTAALGPVLYESQLLVDLTPVLTSGQYHGRIAATVDVAVVARGLSDLFQGAVFRWVREPEAVLPQTVDGVIALMLRAITTDSDPCAPTSARSSSPWS